MSSELIFDRPSIDDGLAVSKLISHCPPLDTNSVYCNLLQCYHFSSTSVAVKRCDELVGFISAYLIPETPDRLFVWQVAVSEKVRGQGLASKMIAHILAREVCASVRVLQTTITESNQASWGLFTRFAEKHAAPLSSEQLFVAGKHLPAQHNTEVLVTIGPWLSGSLEL
jgi:L-2,4-diaminobutyric acid acetyltransferase